MKNLKRYFVITMIALSIAIPATIWLLDAPPEAQGPVLIASGPDSASGSDSFPPIQLPDNSSSRGYSWGD